MQPEKAKHCMIPTTRHSGNDKTMETIKRSVVARGWGDGRRETGSDCLMGAEIQFYRMKSCGDGWW